MKILLASIIALSSVTPAMAHHSQAGYSSSKEWFLKLYIEKSIFQELETILATSKHITRQWLFPVKGEKNKSHTATTSAV